MRLGCAESPEDVPENAVLKEVSWSQTAMSADECFWFTAGRPQWDTEADGRFLNCEFRAEDGGFVERRDAPLSDAQWTELESLIHTLALLPYTPPDENLLDAANSEITLTWKNGGETVKKRYAGSNADTLYALLLELAARTQSTGGAGETEYDS